MKFIYLLAVLALATTSCKDHETQEEVVMTDTVAQASIDPVSPEGMEDAIIYEANIRQYSPEGTFEAFTQDIPQLKELGVDVIWLMPVHPISMKNRKAKGDLNVEDIEDEEERKKYLGSYYSISDYQAINPEFGTKEDFDKLVATAHENGMYVILDWVANHTGWDHQWIQDHPEYYIKDKDGNVSDPINPDTGESWGWTDVAKLDFENKQLWEAMAADMKYWIAEHDVDGYRCDVAGNVPTEFWEFVVPQLKEIKPVFMLAESEDKPLFKNAFDMGYNWEGHHIMNGLAQGEKTVKDWHEYMERVAADYEEDDYLMNFTTNHDENSWNGTVQERMGDNKDVMLAMAYTLPGMPLIYSGQEYDLDHRLKFFEKDSIPKEKGNTWKLLQKLAKVKKEHPALHGGVAAGDYTPLETGYDDVIAFRRMKGDDAVFFVANLSDEDRKVKLDLAGGYKDEINGYTMAVSTREPLTIRPHVYHILTPVK